MDGKKWRGGKLRAIRDAGVEWLFPAHCVLCLAPAPKGLCSACHADLPVWRSDCLRCGDPLAQDGFCPTCARTPSPLASFRAAARYAWPLQQMILAWKNGGRRDLAEPLAQVFCQAFVSGNTFLPDRVLPVPLHPQRLNQRGFNQAEILASAVCQQNGWRLDSHSLSRTRATPHQQGLTRRQRQTNLREAFSVQPNLRGEHVLLVDDVMTTGATLHAVALKLQAEGVASVSAIVLARA
jgi:ComF family protein